MIASRPARGDGARSAQRCAGEVALHYSPRMNPSARLSRRQALAMLGTAGATALTGHSYRADAAQPASALGGALARNDAAVRTLLATRSPIPRARRVARCQYYQPLAEKVASQSWDESRRRRRQSEVCRLEQSADLAETRNGFSIRLRASGTDGVPVAVEPSFREGGILDSCRPVADLPGMFVLEQDTGTYRAEGCTIRFGPGNPPHRYTQVRGAEPRLPGLSVYLTGGS
jgi:hypothetical protein